MNRYFVFDEPGDAEKLHIVSGPIPIPQAGEVLIKTYCIGINPIDIKTRSGKGLYELLSRYSPIIPGWDICGEVIQTGSSGSKFHIGDIVFGMINFPGYGRAYSEYVAAPEAHLCLKPDNITSEEACGASLAALTAWQSLVTQASIKAGQRVMIHAAAGGVGHFAVQIARSFDTVVYGTCSRRNLDFIKSLGVAHPVDYQSIPLECLPPDMDIVIDPLGGSVTTRSVRLLKKDGVLVSLVGGVTDEVSRLARERSANAINYRVVSSGEDTRKIAEMLKDQRLKTRVSEVYSFERIPEAHKQIESGHTRGKLIVKLS